MMTEQRLQQQAEGQPVLKTEWQRLVDERDAALAERDARQLIPLLREGIRKMEDDPATFIALNPENGWGSYETFLPWLKEYLAACEENPDATVRVSR